MFGITVIRNLTTLSSQCRHFRFDRIENGTGGLHSRTEPEIIGSTHMAQAILRKVLDNPHFSDHNGTDDAFNGDVGQGVRWILLKTCRFTSLPDKPVFLTRVREIISRTAPLHLIGLAKPTSATLLHLQNDINYFHSDS